MGGRESPEGETEMTTTNSTEILTVARAVREQSPNLGYHGVLTQVADRLGRGITQSEQEAVYDALFAPSDDEV